MSRHETVATSAELEAQVSGLSRLSVEIAREPALSRRLTDFFDTYVRPDTLAFGYGNGHLWNYGYSEFSGIGTNDTLLHVRNCSNDSYEDEKVVVLGSLGSDEVAIHPIEHITRYRDFDGDMKVSFELGTAAGEDEDRAELEIVDDIDDWIESQSYQTRTIRRSRQAWELDDGRVFERFNDIYLLQAQVLEAKHRGIGRVSIAVVKTLEPVTDLGQSGEGMVA